MIPASRPLQCHAPPKTVVVAEGVVAEGPLGKYGRGAAGDEGGIVAGAA